ncbi:alpha/beta hydrolase [Flavobacterium sp. UBA6135]|uniref:alpha/beta hydrolase n=1 Tax=Flavobacterium sp. UBA6135 TaxID=1946553 RepID=UPI0025BF6A53|nr:alpha/beta hydrolase [Flavobacterium sp. UBA6135]
MKDITFILLLTLGTFGFSQVQKDTSYTIQSEFKKQIKSFPQIEVVKSLNNNFLVEKKDIVYQTISNRNLHFDFYSNNSKTISPAIIMLHGGGWNSGDKSMLQPLAQQLALNNYKCFVIEYRLSDEAIYPAAINDVLKALEFIVKNATDYSIDVNKIVILGCSSGGQMASLIGTKFNSPIKAIVNLDGILAFHHPQSKEGKLASKWLGGTYEEKPEVWKDASALSHVSKNTPPFLFINSQYERFHAGRDDMITKMKTFNIDTKIEMINDSPHTFWLFHPWFEKTTNYIVTFLDEKLKS